MIEHNKIYTHVIDIIKRYASEDNPIDQSEIMEKLQEDPDTQCERKTLSRALERLRAEYGPDEDGNFPDENMKLNFITVERSSSPIYRQYWFEINGGKFSDEELMFLMLAAQFSKHVAQNYADDIVKKLRSLSDNKYSSKFELFTVLNEKNHPVSKDFFRYLDDINRAIDKDRMISFILMEYGTDKKLHPVRNERVEVSPYKVVGLDGDLYLLCTKRDSRVLKSYRIDRISDVKMLDENSQHPAQKSTARFRTNEYLSEHRYLYSGDVVNVTMLIDRSILGDVIDSFGNKFEIEPADESVNRLTIQLKTCERDVIDWAMRYGEHALVLEPEYLRCEIRDRASLLSGFYRAEETDIHYLEAIERAERFHRISLINTDLNGQDSYKHLNRIHSITMRHNGISDFSFLSGYDGLYELEISNNEISDPSVLAGLSELRELDLAMTGITDLNFLTGLEHLSRLTLHEYSLEDVEAIYSLPGLKYLVVNNPVARLIDKNRLRRVYGPEFKYAVEDGNTLFSSRFGLRSLPPDERSYHPLRGEAEAAEAFATCELTDISLKTALCRKVYIRARRGSFEEKCFRPIEGSYDHAEERSMYEDLEHYASEEYSWYVTYEGAPGEQLSVNDINRISIISIFKRDHGSKLAVMLHRTHTSDRSDRTDNRSYRESHIISSVFQYVHIRYLIDNNIGWAEVSEWMERMFFRFCTINEIVNPALLMNYNVFEKIEIDVDDYHYYRKDGRYKANKIVYGHIELR